MRDTNPMQPPTIKQLLKKLFSDIMSHEQETSRLNFEMGDLLNSHAAETGLTAKEVAFDFERESGIGWKRFDTNGRIARRIPLHHRTRNVPWGVIQHIIVEMNPRNFNISEPVFCDAAIGALKEVERENLKLVDLKKIDGNSTVGEQLVRRYIVQ
jgi:hypothetical protein